MTKPLKTNDHVINTRLRKIFSLGKSDADLDDTLAEIDNLPGCLPFRVGDILVSQQQAQVIPGVLKPKPSSLLFKTALDSGDGCPFLVTDAVVTGEQALFAVMLTDADNCSQDVEKWMRAMPSKPSLIAGNYRGHVLIAAPLTSFIP